MFDGIDKNIIACETSGIFKKEQLDEVLSTSCSASSKIFQFYRDAVKKSTINND